MKAPEAVAVLIFALIGSTICLVGTSVFLGLIALIKFLIQFIFGV